MSAPSEHIAMSVGELREAIEQMPNGPLVSGPYFAQWPTTGRHRINSWVGDVEQALQWAANGIEEAERRGTGSARQLEEALWRLDAADDRMVVVISLALGVTLVRLTKDRRGVAFTSDRRRVLSKLADLGSLPAMNLMSVMARWNEHPARMLRNEVTHSLSQTTETQPLLDLDVRYLRTGSESYREARLLYPDDLHMGSGDIRPAAVWQRVIDQAKDGLSVMVECVRAAAAAIRSDARLEPPPIAYYDLDSDVASLAP
jgi:hypothetical protein